MVGTIPDFLVCPICLEAFYKPVTLSCGHTFCKNCWFDSHKANNSCPVCRCPCKNALSISDNVVINQILHSTIPNYETYCAEIESKLRSRICDVSFKWNGPLLDIALILIPQQIMRLNLFEPKFIRLFEIANATDSIFCVHQSGTQDSIGFLVKILDFHRTLRGTIDCRVQAIHRCIFLRNAECGVNSVDGLKMAVVESVEDIDKLTASSDLPSQERKMLNDLISLIPRLEGCLELAQREFLRNACGDFQQALEGPWQDLTYWMMTAFRLSHQDKLNIISKTRAADRIRYLHAFCVAAGAIKLNSSIDVLADNDELQRLACLVFVIGEGRLLSPHGWRYCMWLIIVLCAWIYSSYIEG